MVQNTNGIGTFFVHHCIKTYFKELQLQKNDRHKWQINQSTALLGRKWPATLYSTHANKCIYVHDSHYKHHTGTHHTYIKHTYLMYQHKEYWMV